MHQRSSSPKLSSPDRRSRPAFDRDVAERVVDRDEHVDQVFRLRRAAVIGIAAWVAFGLVDWFIVAFVEPGRLWVYWAIRAIGLALLIAASIRVFAKPMPTPRLLRAIDVFVFSAMSALISLQCIEFGGIASPLALGVLTVLVCRSAIISEHWRRGALPIGAIVFVHPAVLILLGLLNDRIALQFADSVAVGGFVLNLLFLTGAASIMLMGGHTIWALRRKVFQSRSLGRYKLKQRIGEGGMGEIWIAHHQQLKRDVAVKILRPDRYRDKVAVRQSSIRRFEREVQATAELTHPNTIRVFDYGVTEDGLCYYAMELLRGRDLGVVLEQEGPLDVERAVYILWQAAQALAEAHARGIVHRDLKPDNIFLTSCGRDRDYVKVLDFGLAKHLVEDGRAPQLTEAGFAMGTPWYISPEVIKGRQATVSSDIYGLGAVLYHLLCGRPPFDRRGVQAILVAHMREEALLPSQKLGKRLPSSVEQVVMKCLRKDPERRYRSAEEFADALDNCRRQLALVGHYQPDGRATGTALKRDIPGADPDTLVEPFRSLLADAGAPRADYSQ